MKINVVFFASIREDLGMASLAVELPDNSSVSDLVKQLGDTHGEVWLQSLNAENIRVALNQTLVSDDPKLSDEDEVAFFPPVTGG